MVLLIILTILNAVCITTLIVLLQNIKKTASPWVYRIYLFYNINFSLLLDKSYNINYKDY